MAISDISLTEAMRANLRSLQLTSDLMARTVERLGSGKKVNSPIDDPVTYFTAQSHLSRADDLSALKDGMSEGIQTIQAANYGIDSIRGLIEQAKGLAIAAKTSAAVGELEAQYDVLVAQISQLADDSGYKGVNLLDNDTLTVVFNEGGTSTLAVTGFDATTANQVDGDPITAATGFWTAAPANIDTSISELNTILGNLEGKATALSTNLSIIQTRMDFTTEMIDTLQVGADNLTLADMNEESANLLMLQTRQQLGISALQMATEEAQGVLRLFS